jgi:hypothetical protein
MEDGKQEKNVVKFYFKILDEKNKMSMKKLSFCHLRNMISSVPLKPGPSAIKLIAD